MDWTEAWSKTAVITKSGRRASAAHATNALDALGSMCAPLAARWDAEADRRTKLRTPENLKALMVAQRNHNTARGTAKVARSQRTAARSASKNPWAAPRRAAKVAERAARSHAAEAKSALVEARRSYPSTLTRVAVQAHALHSLPAAAATYALSTPADWATWPVATSVGLVAAHVGALVLGRRQAAPLELEEDLSAEERRLVERLDPSWWVQHAEGRGLAGTVTSPPEVTPGGLVSHVRLDNRWTPKSFQDKADQVRALLGARTDLRMEIGKGSHGDRATITLRTRSAADGDDLKWSYERQSFGVDTVTGDLVDIPLGERLLIAGRSGAGKSVASRPLLFKASEGEQNRLVIIDLKKVEGRLWDHRARVASDADAVIALVEELVQEMTERLSTLPKGQATLVPTADLPRITVVVDEGAEVVSVCDDVETVVDWTAKGKPVTEKRSALPGLESLARMGRAACVDLWWMTQKPTIGDGVPKQIAPQMSTSVCLAVRTPTEARVVLGEDAQAKGWNADELPAPGVALVRDGKRGPAPIAVRYMTDEQVMALPSRPLWSRSAGSQQPEEPKGTPLRLVKDEAPAASAPTPPAAPETNRDRVLRAVRDGATSSKAVVDATGINKGSVSKALKVLVEAGEVVRAGDGTLSLPAEEVSA